MNSLRPLEQMPPEFEYDVLPKGTEVIVRSERYIQSHSVVQRTRQCLPGKITEFVPERNVYNIDYETKDHPEFGR